jgi:glycosyltransferase involved in cell wall biosynthesis
LKYQVSVILLSFNQSAYIQKCLDAFEKQTFKEFEIIVIDDGSADRSLEIINEWSKGTQISNKIISNVQNLGICKTINKALSYASGTFVSIMACDDWPDKNYLKIMLDSISAQEDNVAFVFAQTREVSEKGIPFNSKYVEIESKAHLYKPPVLFEGLLKANKVQAPAVMIRKSALDVCGKYDESLFFEDYDMWLRLSNSYPVLEINQILVNYRIVAKSMSRNSQSFLARKKSEMEILLKWAGSSNSNDQVIANRIRNLSIEFLKDNQISIALSFLDEANLVRFDLRWFIFRQLSRLNFFVVFAQKRLIK